MGLGVSCRCGGSGAPEFGSWSRSANAGGVGTPKITAATASQLRMRSGLLPHEARVARILLIRGRNVPASPRGDWLACAGRFAGLLERDCERGEGARFRRATQAR